MLGKCMRTVTLNGTALNVSLIGSPVPVGNKVTLITQATSIYGTFTGLPGGATFTVSGQQFSISYVGGGGHDVVITALTAGTPSEFNYNATTKTLIITLTAARPNFTFSQVTAASGTTTSSVYTFTLSGSGSPVSQSFTDAQMTTTPASGSATVTVIGQGAPSTAVSPGNDKFVGETVRSYMFSTGPSGNFTEFDAAYAFAAVFGQSFVGGFDTAVNTDPTKNILVGFH
jgi:hypothetical protein